MRRRSLIPTSALLTFFISTFLLPDILVAAEYNMVKYVEQDRESQKCSYLGPIQNRN